MGKGTFLHHQQMAVFVNSLDQTVDANREIISYSWSLSFSTSIPAILLIFGLKMCHLRALLCRHCTIYVHAYGTVYLSYYGHRSRPARSHTEGPLTPQTGKRVSLHSYLCLSNITLNPHPVGATYII